MNIPSVDHAILSGLTSFSGHSILFDRFVLGLSSNDLLKGVTIVSIFWWIWFRDDPNQSKNRERLISTTLSAIPAMSVARVLAITLPFRFRPVHSDLGFVFPSGSELRLIDWSSFPSDHAALFFTLSAGLLFVSRTAGVFAMAWTFIVICFPRIYLGWHYPTDIMAGAVIGIGFACLGNLMGVVGRISRSILTWETKNPGLFYWSFFIISFEIADLFESVRRIFAFIYKAFKPILL